MRALPATFKTLWGSKVGASFRDVAVVKEVPMSGPREGEVLVQVAYAGVNGGCETFRSRGEHWFADNREKQAGFALGAEGVGLVAAVGPGVDGLAVGDAVSFVGGAFAEYVIAAAVRCSRIRSATPEAAAARISGSTAMGAVLSMGEAKKGQVVLVTAGAGAAGSFAVQIAKHLGCKVVATCGSAEKAQLLCSLGCDTIINYRTRDLDAALSKAYPQGVDLVVEHVGGDMFRTALRHLKDDGRLILVGYISEYPHTNAYASGHTAVPSESLGSAAAHDATTTQAFDLADIFWNQRVVEVAGTHKTIYGKLYPSMEAAGAARVQLQQLLDEGNIKALVDARQFVGVGRLQPL